MGAAAVCIFLSLELFCRLVLGLGDPPLSRADPEIEYLFVGPRTYHRFGNSITYNAYSMRTRDFAARRVDPTEIRVMICGDSVINGGALTDQSRLMSTMLESSLQNEFRRPVVVMNVSAGSWGPPNYWAYVRRNGLFDADVLVIVVSSHDWADVPTHEPVVGVEQDFPDRTPPLALIEAVTRYLPRIAGELRTTAVAGPHEDEAPPAHVAQAMKAFEELVMFARQRDVPVIVAQHLERGESTEPERQGHRMFREAADALRVERVQWRTAFEEAMRARRSPYRDEIHPNDDGQALMARVLYPAVARKLREK